MSNTATTPAAPTRNINGAAVPAVGVWDIDPGHADVAFTGRHFMLTKVRGRFTDVQGSIMIADKISESHVDVVIGMASVESGYKVRDDHIKSAELFDVEKFPQATFRSVSIDWRGTEAVVNGDLTIHGVTRRVSLAVSFEGCARDPFGDDRAVFSASTRVNREDFGITWNMTLETGGLLVSKEIEISIEVEAVRRAESSS
jgi:polyisoprenoid-binding protein YceI